MTSRTPAPGDESALALREEHAALEPATQPAVGLLPLALVLIVLLLFVAAAWTLLAAGG
jgi:hypothetical protein